MGEKTWMRVLTVAVLASAIVGCADYDVPSNPESLSTWEATLAPVSMAPDPDTPIVSGQAAAVVMSGRTEIGIGVQGVEEELYWGLYRGTCDQPGEIFGTAQQYPPLTAERAEAETAIESELVGGQEYHVQVNGDETGSSPLACGNLFRTDHV